MRIRLLPLGPHQIRFSPLVMASMIISQKQLVVIKFQTFRHSNIYNLYNLYPSEDLEEEPGGGKVLAAPVLGRCEAWRHARHRQEKSRQKETAEGKGFGQKCSCISSFRHRRVCRHCNSTAATAPILVGQCDSSAATS